jgi:hypothetical protein
MRLIMHDNSEYNETDKDVLRAFKIRLQENPNFMELFIAATNLHWRNKTEPTKFDIDIPFETPYKNQAELAPKVLYVFLRPVLMGIWMERLSNGEGKVYATGNDGQTTEYPSGKKIDMIKEDKHANRENTIK